MKKTYVNKDRLPPKEYWEGIRRRFAPLWACYPLEGRRNYENCYKYYHKIKASMPSMAYLCGVVAHLSANVWGDYPPSLMKFMENKEWAGIDDCEKARMERNMSHWETELQKKIATFNGVSYKVQNNMQQKPQEESQEPLSIPDFVPSADEVSRMPSLEFEKLKSKCGYGHIYTPDFVKAVSLRDQLRKENSQTQEENMMPDW